MYNSFSQTSTTPFNSFLGILSLDLVGATLVALYIRCDWQVFSIALKNLIYIAIPHAFSPASENPFSDNDFLSGTCFRPLKMYLSTWNLAASFISATHFNHLFLISSGSLSSHPKELPSLFL